MNEMMVSFMDELSKIAGSGGSNAVAPLAMKSGMGSNSMMASASGSKSFMTTPKANPAKGAVSAKPTNYSIVHSEAPSAAFGSTASTSKAVPPPPVRT